MRGLVCTLLALLVSNAPSVAADSCRTPMTDRPTIALVLGGGGARGSAHIGVIRALEELRVPVDCVVGTSMGSLVGALYATGMTADEMEETISAIDWKQLFQDETSREDQPYRRKRDDEIYALFGPKIGIGADTSLITTGLISGQNINFLFESLLSQREEVSNFDELPLPFRAVAADLLTGEAVVMRNGSLALAMRASMSVPAVFDPVEWDGRLLVDGGIVNNLPVTVARDMGADIVIAVDVGSGGLTKDKIRNVLSVVSQLTNLMVMSNVEASRKLLSENDVLIKPALGTEISSADFDKASQGAAIGYKSTMENPQVLIGLSLTESDYQGYVASLSQRKPELPIIEFVRLDNQSQFSDALILHQLNVELGQPLDQATLEDDIALIYGLGFLEMVRYEVVEDGDQRGLQLYVKQDTRGTQYIEWGMDLFADDLTNGFNLRLGWLKTDVDELGSEFRVAGQLGRQKSLVLDLYKYFDRSANLFVNPRLFAESQEFTEFVADQPTGIVDVQLYGGDVAVGREFSRHSALSAGIRSFVGSADTLIGDIASAEEDFDGGEVFLDFTYDRLDDRYFPDNGNFSRITYYDSADWLGSDDDYEQLATSVIVARSYGPHTFLGAFAANATVGGVAPTYALFAGGDLFQLSAFNPGQIAGQNFGVVTGSYQFRISQGFIPGRVGMSVEYGGISNDWEDLFSRGVVHGSVFAGFRTPIGPAYIGYGMGEGGLRRYFVKFGRVFGRATVIR